jgi:hypothetical protein
VQNQVIVGGPGGGVFVYDPAPGFGNLIASETDATSDLFGNSTLAGKTSYGPGPGGSRIALQMEAFVTAVGVGFAWYSAPSASGPWTLKTSLVTSTSLSNLDILPPAGGTVQIGSPLLINPGFGVFASTAAGTAESWHSVSLPAGMTGSIRVKLLAEGSFAALDVNTVITATNAAPTTYTAGSLPSAAYYPAAARQFALSVNQQWSTVANASPRAAIPASGAVTMPLPGFVTAGAACIVSGTVVYPLD